MPPSNFSSTLTLFEYAQQGLSVGTVSLPMTGAVWRIVRLLPFNLGNPEDPTPSECQVWPRGQAQSQ